MTQSIIGQSKDTLGVNLNVYQRSYLKQMEPNGLENEENASDYLAFKSNLKLIDKNESSSKMYEFLTSLNKDIEILIRFL